MITTTRREKTAIADELATMRARRILEIGAYRGETTALLSRAATPDGYVVVIDPMRWSSAPSDMLERLGSWFSIGDYERSFWKNVHSTGCENVRLIRKLSTDQELAQRKDPTLAEFDAVFIDGDHTYPVVRSDLEIWGRRVRKGGKILLHDATPRWTGVVKAIREWENDSRVKIRWEREGSLCLIDVLSDLRDAASLHKVSASAATERRAG